MRTPTASVNYTSSAGVSGHFTRQAYAFFVVPEGKTINSGTKERLDAIQEYAELGAGFKLAMRDLELRGAGNILGAQQSGHIEAIGYELYCRLLNEAVNRLRGNDASDAPQIGLQAAHKGGHRIAFPVDATFRTNGWKHRSLNSSSTNY